jgi:hypothetical protein
LSDEGYSLWMLRVNDREGVFSFGLVGNSGKVANPAFQIGLHPRGCRQWGPGEKGGLRGCTGRGMAFLAVFLCLLLTIPHARASALPSSFVAEACKALQEQRGEPHCDPVKLYYSVLPNGERRFAEARRCALAQYAKALKLCPPKAQQRVCPKGCFENTQDWDNNPAEILANLYANGLGGAPKDLKLAGIFAQQAFPDEDSADFAKNVKFFLDQVKEYGHILPKYFDLYGSGHGSVSSPIDEQDRAQAEFQAEVEAFLKRYQVTLPPASRKAFTRLREEFEHFQSHDCVTPFTAMGLRGR